MDRAAQAFAEARNRMVDSQIRPNKVTDPRIIAAMRQLPRERFVPPRLAALAYADEDVPLGEGRVLMEPMVIARLVQLDRRSPPASARWWSPPAPATARRCWPPAAPGSPRSRMPRRCGTPRAACWRNWRRRSAWSPARSAAGWPPGAPYDVILIEGAVRDIPPPIGEQLHGRPAGWSRSAPAAAGLGQAVLAEATAAGLRMQPMFDCATPPIPSLHADRRLRFLIDMP